MHTFTLFVKHHFEDDSVKVCFVFDENHHFIALRSCWTRPSGISAQNLDFAFVCDWHCLSCIMSLFSQSRHALPVRLSGTFVLFSSFEGLGSCYAQMGSHPYETLEEI